jgi:hypothetical protein
MSETILILTNDEGTVEGGKSAWSESAKNQISKTVEVAAEVLEQNMQQFLENVGKLFKQADAGISSQSDLRLDEVELEVKISATGEVKLFVGSELAGEGTIKLKFKRQP